MAKLLFVNTFCHETIENFNIDFVKFSAGALATVREIRIIPGGARIPIAEAPQRQGLTAPNTFGLEIFAKTFTRTDSNVFARIANFEYHFDSDIRFQIPAHTTDGILFKGNYTALTVAIYGDPVSGEVDSSQLSIQSTVSVPGVSDTSTGGGLLAPATIFPGQPANPILTVGTPIPTWVGPPPPAVMHMPPPATYNPMLPPPISIIQPYSPAPTATGVFPSAGPPAPVVVPAVFDPTRPPPTFLTPQHSPQMTSQKQQVSPSEHRIHSQPSSRRHHEHSSKGKKYSSNGSGRTQSTEGKGTGSVARQITSSQGAHRSALSSHAEPMEEHQLEEGEYANSEGESSEKFDLENISEEEFEFDDTVAADLNEIELQEDLLSSICFDPFSFVLEPLKHFKNPAFSAFETELVESIRATTPKDYTIDKQKLILLLESCEIGVCNEKWINSVESACNIIITGLVPLIKRGTATDIIDRLVAWTIDGLDMEKACQQQRVYIVRHLKAGVRLVTILFQTNRSVAGRLCREGVIQRLLDLLESDVASTPLMLQIMKALDAATLFDVGLQTLLHATDDYQGNGKGQTQFQRLVRFVLQKRVT